MVWNLPKNEYDLGEDGQPKLVPELQEEIVRLGRFKDWSAADDDGGDRDVVLLENAEESTASIVEVNGTVLRHLSFEGEVDPDGGTHKNPFTIREFTDNEHEALRTLLDAVQGASQGEGSDLPE